MDTLSQAECIALRDDGHCYDSLHNNVRQVSCRATCLGCSAPPYQPPPAPSPLPPPPTPPLPGGTPSDADGGGADVGLIVGLSAGGLVLVGGGLWLWLRGTSSAGATRLRPDALYDYAGGGL